ncbi:hypothetical protein GCM10010193_28810 [Kitasatospora atroaurantiaca]|uniref:Cupredoxin-like protein n=1 Tax=Kitasatospora atroaurantiaca TaxID=285545 RepID=A0A561EIX1_9ACTN|nr:cupredoxin domain-containing protein [Kitasatospora atroaurantiaca]TWE15565.1 cupredoxin-like protein [Kitasatospora atroaurantiaca]
MRSHRSLAAIGAALLALPLLAACGDGKDTAASADSAKVAITATDSACDLAKSDFKAGEVTFAIRNKGDRVTEVYVYGDHNGAFTKVVSELENIGPGTTRDMTVKLAAGTYEIACKPGQTGDGIRKKITVAGDTADQKTSAQPSGTAESAKPSQTSESAYDREVEVEAKEYELKFEGMETFTAKAGEKIEFKLENKGSVEHELEVFGPDGKEIGEVSPVKPGQTGEAVITLAVPGTYTLKCGIGNHADHGMKTTFTVS